MWLKREKKLRKIISTKPCDILSFYLIAPARVNKIKFTQWDTPKKVNNISTKITCLCDWKKKKLRKIISTKPCDILRFYLIEPARVNKIKFAQWDTPKKVNNTSTKITYLCDWREKKLWKIISTKPCDILCFYLIAPERVETKMRKTLKNYFLPNDKRFTFWAIAKEVTPIQYSILMLFDSGKYMLTCWLPLICTFIMNNFSLSD